ncbi:MAG: hypothetical protein KGJ11_07425, partial [Candidatus Omnitrophica bacterium]|nr:hypothetical protein [Candidatus Omnitrophota bacterium]
LGSWLPFITQTSLDKLSYIDIKNQSLFSMVIRSFSASGMGVNIMHLSFEQGKILGIAISALLYALVLVKGKRQPGQAGLDAALLFCFMALFNPNGWELNFVALGLPYILLIGYLIEVKWKDSFVTMSVIMAAVLSSVFARDVLGKVMENDSNLCSNVTIATLLLIAALFQLKFLKIKSINGKEVV